MPNRPKMVWVKCDVTPDKLTPEFVKRAVQLDKTSGTTGILCEGQKEGDVPLRGAKRTSRTWISTERKGRCKR